MKVYDLKNEEGKTFAFEISNLFVGRQGVVRTVRKIPQATLHKLPKLFSGEDVFCEFEVDGCMFEVSEDWGDSSRYWIGPKDRKWHPEIQIVREAFLQK
jgi:hypothetical protein